VLDSKDDRSQVYASFEKADAFSHLACA